MAGVIKRYHYLQEARPLDLSAEFRDPLMDLQHRPAADCWLRKRSVGPFV